MDSFMVVMIYTLGKDWERISCRKW